MVAKSYQSLEQIGEPYTSNNKQYVKVRTTTGATKVVRWYTEAEYRKMYPNETISATPSYDQKTALGFSKGYITIFKGNTYEDREWFKNSSARYTRFWGWYFVSEEKIPKDLPEDVSPILLKWEDVSVNNVLLPEDQLKKIVEGFLFDPSSSQYIGNIGERLSLKLRVDKIVESNTNYGVSNIHTMHDEHDNIFVWATTARKLNIGSWYTMTGGIKEHKMYQNSKQTWLTRCLSIKEVE